MLADLQSGTAEAVAYALMQDVMLAERRALTADPLVGWQTADRGYLLDLYAECRHAVNGERPSDTDGPSVSGATVKANAES